MELGGSDPALVLEDANLENAVRGVVWGRFTNAGQTCAATKRCFVHRSLYDRFVAAAVQQVAALRVGMPDDPRTDVSCLTDPRSVQEMVELVEDARKRGGRVLAGGKPRLDLGPQFFEPTVVVDLPEDARLLAEECFGPILPIVPFDAEDEAVRLANATRFGLCASVYTGDAQRGAALASRLEAGTVTVNDSLFVFAASETPWGGVKDSGHGRTHGAWGLLELVRMKHVNESPSRRQPTLWWFPYDENAADTLERGLAFLYGGAAEKVKQAPTMTKRILSKRNY
jgi:succinate-semialdehyde dehydrogenase/glutarate-semialdehyde dehydrogenase